MWTLELRSALLLALATAVGASCHPPEANVATAARGSDDAGIGDATTDDGDGSDADAVVEADASALVETNDAGVDESECLRGMVLVSGERRFCIDKYEAALVEILPDGSEQPFPHYMPVDGHVVRAISEPSVFPQGYVSEVQAADACAASGKRLCAYEEWKIACMGPSRTTFPYGDARRPGACHDTGKSAVIAVFGEKAVAASNAALPLVKKGTKKPPATSARKPAKTSGGKRDAKRRGTSKARPARSSARPSSVDPGVWARLNDPALGKVEGALARTGEHPACANEYGVFDIVGNLHEWVVTSPAGANGTFAGGYYLDTTINGDGCNYRTRAHAHEYHDYSTGFRCCADAP